MPCPPHASDHLLRAFRIHGEHRPHNPHLPSALGALDALAREPDPPGAGRRTRLPAPAHSTTITALIAVLDLLHRPATGRPGPDRADRKIRTPPPPGLAVCLVIPPPRPPRWSSWRSPRASTAPSRPRRPPPANRAIVGFARASRRVGRIADRHRQVDLVGLVVERIVRRGHQPSVLDGLSHGAHAGAPGRLRLVLRAMLYAGFSAVRDNPATVDRIPDWLAEERRTRRPPAGLSAPADARGSGRVLDGRRREYHGKAGYLQAGQNPLAGEIRKHGVIDPALGEPSRPHPATGADAGGVAATLPGLHQRVPASRRECGGDRP